MPSSKLYSIKIENGSSNDCLPIDPKVDAWAIRALLQQLRLEDLRWPSLPLWTELVNTESAAADLPCTALRLRRLLELVLGALHLARQQQHPHLDHWPIQGWSLVLACIHARSERREGWTQLSDADLVDVSSAFEDFVRAAELREADYFYAEMLHRSLFVHANSTALQPLSTFAVYHEVASSAKPGRLSSWKQTFLLALTPPVAKEPVLAEWSSDDEIDWNARKRRRARAFAAASASRSDCFMQTAGLRDRGAFVLSLFISAAIVAVPVLDARQERFLTFLLPFLSLLLLCAAVATPRNQLRAQLLTWANLVKIGRAHV